MLQSALPHNLPLRLVDPAKIHLTLQFLGDTPESQVPNVDGLSEEDAVATLEDAGFVVNVQREARPVERASFLKVGFTEMGQCAAAVCRRWDH